MSVELRIDRSRLERLLRRRGGAVERRLRERTDQVAQFAREEAAGHGTMPDYITSRVEEGSRGLAGVVTSGHPASLYVLLGTRPHIIRPRKKKGVLRFEVGGEVVFAKVVRHPGYKGDNFLARALDRARSR